MAVQELKDSRGIKIGEIRNEGNKQVIYDNRGIKLGSFDGRDTFDNRGIKIGSGNLLTTFLTRI